MTKSTSLPSPEEIQQRLLEQGRAYANLVRGANTLLARHVFWAERLLLRLVRYLYTSRLREMVLFLPPELSDEILVEDNHTEASTNNSKPADFI